jgi:hypothetical protein
MRSTSRLLKASLVAIAVLAGCNAPRTEAAAGLTPIDSLLGTWRVERFIEPSTRVARGLQFGRAPRGYLIYDQSGHMLFQVVSTASLDSLRKYRVGGASDSLFRRQMASASFYWCFGTFIADPVNRRIAHLLEGEMPPSLGTMEVSTPYRLAGDTLILGRDSLQTGIQARWDGGTWVFRRVTPVARTQR